MEPGQAWLLPPSLHDFTVVTGLQKPDFRTISDFRKRHLGALSGLFGRVLALCRRAGLVKLGHVALDGTKIKVSKHKAMSYARMVKAEAELSAEVEACCARAEAAAGAPPKEHSADAGYRSEDNFEALEVRAIRGLHRHRATTARRSGRRLRPHRPASWHRSSNRSTEANP